MKILDDLINTLEPAEIKDIRMGVFTTAVISRQCGLSSTVHPDHHDHSVKINDAGDLIGKNIQEIALKVKSSYVLEASLGMACINSGLHLDGLKFVGVNAEEIIRDKGKNKNVAVIGHFPFVERLRPHVKNLYVFEKHLSEGDIPAQQIPGILPDVAVVAMTGTTLINHTFDEIMNYTRKDAFKIMLGPSTPLNKILFDYGLDVLSGVIVEDISTVLNYIQQGASFQQIRGKRLVAIMKE